MSLTHRGLRKLLAPTRRCVGGVESTYGAVHLPGGGTQSPMGCGSWCKQQHKDTVVEVSLWTPSRTAEGQMAPHHSWASCVSQ